MSGLSPFVGTLPLKSETTMAINGVGEYNKSHIDKMNKHKQQYNSIDVDGNCDGRLIIGIKNLNH